MAYRMPEHIVASGDTVDHCLTVEGIGDRSLWLLDVRCVVRPRWHRCRECMCGWPSDAEAGLLLVVRRGSVGLRPVV